MSAADRREFYRTTGGPATPSAVFDYEDDGRVAATVPYGGLTVLDQQALGLASALAESWQGVLDWDRIAEEAYLGAAALLRRKRLVEDPLAG